ncbi:MAG: hypothetical protein AMXMBFR7_11400 [Planctomycetota bacterium]
MSDRDKTSESRPKPDPRTDLITYRIRLGMTLRDMSKKTGLSPATLFRLEHGKVKATPRSKVKLQDGLGLSTEQIDFLLRQCITKPRSKKVNGHS